MNKARILLLEDDLNLSGLVRDYLHLFDYQLDLAETGQVFHQRLSEHSYDLILLDLNLPDADGLELLKTLRQQSNVLLYVLSGRKDETCRLRALELGADDFIAKPFSIKELELQIRNALKRSQTLPANLDAAAKQPLSWQLDSLRRQLKHPALGEMELTKGEFELVHKLFEAQGGVVNREQLFQHLATHANLGNPESITTLIYRLRRKFNSLNADCPICTVSGEGYKLINP